MFDIFLELSVVKFIGWYVVIIIIRELMILLNFFDVMSKWEG